MRVGDVIKSLSDGEIGIVIKVIPLLYKRNPKYDVAEEYMRTIPRFNKNIGTKIPPILEVYIKWSNGIVEKLYREKGRPCDDFNQRHLRMIRPYEVNDILINKEGRRCFVIKATWPEKGEQVIIIQWEDNCEKEKLKHNMFEGESEVKNRGLYRIPGDAFGRNRCGYGFGGGAPKWGIPKPKVEGIFSILDLRIFSETIEELLKKDNTITKEMIEALYGGIPSDLIKQKKKEK